MIFKRKDNQKDNSLDDTNTISPDDDNVLTPDDGSNTPADNIDDVADMGDGSDMPSANVSGRDGGTKKKLQLAALGFVGVTIILLGVGLSLSNYEANREEERVLEAEAAAREQKQLANGKTIDISSDQEQIVHDLPPPSGLEDETMEGMETTDTVPAPPVQPLPEPAYEPIPAPAYEPVPNSAMVSSTPSYTPPAPIVQSPPPALDMPTDMFVQAPPTVVEPPPVKGSQSSVLVDVNGVSRVTATAVNDDNAEPSRVGGNLRPTVLASASAGRRGDTSLALLKGATIPCVLETKIDSTYQGFVSCRLSRDVYSTNGKTLLLERGTRVVGEQNTELNQGQARVAILWTRADTPKGVSVNLDSPASGKLGEMGVEAKVKTHFWKRFGNSIMLSLIQDVIASGTSRLEEKNGGNNNTTIENTSSTAESMAEQALSNSINIPPTAIINQGSVINITVARDIDFSSVYGVKRK